MTQKKTSHKTGTPLNAMLGALMWGFVAASFLSSAPAAHAQELPKLLVLDTVLFDFMISGTGEKFSTPEDVVRVKLMAETMRKKIAEMGVYQVLPKRPDGNEGQEEVDLSCAECILDIARAQGADLVMTSAVSRVSNIILYLKVELDDIATAKAVKVEEVKFAGFDDPQLQGATLYALDQLFPPPGTEGDSSQSPGGAR